VSEHKIGYRQAGRTTVPIKVADCRATSRRRAR